MSRKLRGYIVKDFLQKFTPLDGVVEVHQMNFIKRKIEIGKSKVKEKLVLILYERNSGQMYMEYINKKSQDGIIDIIRKRVAVGSVIISDEWGPYGYLEDFGYPHYRIDYSRGIVDPTNSNLHLNNIKVTWPWVRQSIKQKNRIAYQLQEHLYEWIWRRNIKRPCEGRLSLITASLLRALFALLRND